MSKLKLKKKKKEIKQVSKAIIHIHSSFNNTIINLTDEKGNSLAWSSAGTLGFKGTRKATPFAATQTAKNIVEKAKNIGVK